ncbi:class C beta-lactamase [Pseudomonas huanghezhanensis]|uniref:class C beta-lactamase n=1 Tax=Pseudomonas huanghezhanensis TaxID=3002903 RepID=UPI002285A0E0|nr:class C beta-lactamase [Pseudomonas sp. BSw22131]
MRISLSHGAAAIFLTLCTTASAAADALHARIESTVDAVLAPMMARYNIPGMAVGVVFEGKPYLFSYGVASRQTGQPVTSDTLFELGSVSKTFTATLAAYAQVKGDLSLSDKTSQYFPSLKQHPFGDVTLINLGTHTPGGLPLQVPEDITNNDQLTRYFEQWQPASAPGTFRTYANPGIGTLGLITAKAMGQDFKTLMEGSLLPALGLSNTYIDVPAPQMTHYAQGYTKDEKPIRVSPGVLSAEAYGIKSNVVDLTRFMQANMKQITLGKAYEQAINDTHTGYYAAGGMTQDLIWEQYPYPVPLKDLQEGNSADMILKPKPVREIQPPMTPRDDVWINKTGSTNGFGTYVAFVPEKRMGIVLLANKNYPNEERVAAAYRILEALTGDAR